MHGSGMGCCIMLVERAYPSIGEDWGKQGEGKCKWNGCSLLGMARGKRNCVGLTKTF